MTDHVAIVRVGEQANPHPSQDPKYMVEVIGGADGEVRVSYIDPKRTNDPWWITERAWRSWRELTK